MWVFTRYGFYSAVAALKPAKDGKGKVVDKKRVVVRARVKSHLTTLLEQFPEELAACEVTADNSRDYRYRIVVRKDKWCEVMFMLAHDIDYDNFKSTCGHGDYHDALMQVWSVMHRMQIVEEWSKDDKGKKGSHRTGRWDLFDGWEPGSGRGVPKREE